MQFWQKRCGSDALMSNHTALQGNHPQFGTVKAVKAVKLSLQHATPRHYVIPALWPVQLHLERKKNVKRFACCTRMCVRIHIYSCIYIFYMYVLVVMILCCWHLEMIVLLGAQLLKNVSGGCFGALGVWSLQCPLAKLHFKSSSL